MWQWWFSKLIKFRTFKVHTGTYWYRLVHTGIYFKKTANFTWSCAILPPAPMIQRRTPGLVLPPSFLPDCSRLHSQTTQAWLATAKVPQPRVDLIHIAATPAIWSCSVCTSHGDERAPVLAKPVWDCGGWVASHTHPSPSAPENNVNTRSIYQYIPVHTGMYQYILVCICM
jgi:hypothetical protein